MKICQKNFLIGICIGILCIFDLSKGEETTNGTFVATKDWQEIKEGQGIPRGLHVRINLRTGKKEAKILDENDKDDDGHHGHEPILLNSSFSLPIVQEDVVATKKLSSIKEQREISEELEEIMKSLPKELPALTLEYTPKKIEEIKKKFGSYEELRKTFNEMKDQFKSDAEIISRLLSEYKNMTEVHAKKSSAATATSADIKVAMQLQILQHLGNLMHQFDNALWFIDSNGLQDVLLPLIANETNTFLRIEAMRVLGALTQNNPKAQVQVFEANFGTHLTQVLLTSTKSEELSVALFAFGSLLRKFPYAQKKIFSTSGSQAVVAVLSKECDLKVKAKAATIISDMIVEQQLELSNLKGNDDQNNLEMQYRELHFDLWLEPHSYCETMDTLITSQFFNLQEMPDLMEYFIQAMNNTKQICYYLWPQSPQLRHSLLTIKNTFANSNNEFHLELADQLKALMKALYLHDEL